MKVDFVLLRSVTRSIKGQDSKNKLLGLLHGGLHSVNSLLSAYLCMDRPVVFGELKKIEKKLGHENFPLISQTLFTDHRNMLFTPTFPIVAKVAHVHAGYGKMMFESTVQYQDFRSLMAVHNDYVSVEPFIKWDYDMRIQKIGPHYRGFKRIGSHWKGNERNTSVVEDMELSEKHLIMIDECAKLFGGLDIIGLDLLHSEENGMEYILELNDTAIGLVHKHEHDDMCIMRDLVIYRMSKLFCYNDEPKEPQDENMIETLQEQINILNGELKLNSNLQRIQRRLEEVENEERVENQDAKQNPIVWFQSIVIIVLLAILFAIITRQNIFPGLQ